MELTGIIMKLNKTTYENIIVNNIFPKYFNMLTDKNAVDDEILYAVCTFDEALQHTSEHVIIID